MKSYNAYLQSEEWRRRRAQAIAHAGGRCQLCNEAKYLNVHHRTYERVGKERPEDLTVLCRKCHEHFHGITGGAQRRLAPVRRGKKESLYKRVLAALRTNNGEMTIKELRTYTGAAKKEIKNVLHAMVHSGAAYETRPGYWIARHKAVA